MRPTPGVTVALGVAWLAVASGCGGSTDDREAAETIAPAGAPALDLAGKPQLLFQVFGTRDSTQLIPLAAVVNGAIRPIGLTAQGWRTLDALYFAPGESAAVYHDDADVGEVIVTHGMWSGGASPVPLPGCKAMMPIGAGTLTFKTPHSDPTVDFIASSAALARHAPYQGRLLTEAEVAKLGRELGHAIGKKAAMDDQELDSLDFHARLIVTGATAEPTMLVSFIDPGAGDVAPGAGHTSHLFVLADKPGAAYEATYRHSASGDARAVEFRRVVDHLDLNGDGIDEIILEAWRYAAQNDLVVLSFKAGQWHEAVRVKQNWCLDAPKTR